MLGRDIVFRAKGRSSGRSTDEILADLRARHPYTGPPVSIADMSETIRENWIASGQRSDK